MFFSLTDVNIFSLYFFQQFYSYFSKFDLSCFSSFFPSFLPPSVPFSFLLPFLLHTFLSSLRLSISFYFTFLLGFWWGSWSCKSMFFIEFWKFSAIISSICFLPPFIKELPTLFDIVPNIPEALLIFILDLFLCFSDCIISINLFLDTFFCHPKAPVNSILSNV